MVCFFFTNLKNTWLQEVGSWEWHLPVFLVPCFQVVMANLWVTALCMYAWRNSVAKVTFQILFLQGQVFSEKGATDLCTFLPTQTEDGLTRDWTCLNHTDQGKRVMFYSRAERLWLSVLLMLFLSGKQNPATLHGQVLRRWSGLTSLVCFWSFLLIFHESFNCVMIPHRVQQRDSQYLVAVWSALAASLSQRSVFINGDVFTLSFL